LCTDEFLDKVEQFIDVVIGFGNCLTAEEQQLRTGSDELTVGQSVLARSSVNGGYWCRAVVIAAGQM